MAKGKGEIKGWITRNGVHIPIYDKYTVREGHEPGEKELRSNFKSKSKASKKFELKHEVWHEDKDGWSVGLTSAGDIYVGTGELDANYYKNTPENKRKALDEYKTGSMTKEKDTKKDAVDDFRKSIEKDIKSKMETHWKWAGDDKERFAASDTERMMEKVDTILDHFKDKRMIEPSKDYDRDIVWRFSGRDKQTGKHADFEFDSYPRESDARETLRGNGYTVSQGLILPKPLFNYLMDHTNVTDTDIDVAKAVMKAALKEYKGSKGIRRGKK